MISEGSYGGTAEVAEFLGCSRQQIHSLRRLPRFPLPVLHLRATPVWDMAEIATFKASWKRRPRKHDE